MPKKVSLTQSPRAIREDNREPSDVHGSEVQLGMDVTRKT
jgi:hypothetical protein